MQAVPELTYALLRPLGAPKGRVQTFTEVRLHDAAEDCLLKDARVELADAGTLASRLSVPPFRVASRSPRA
jgi:hypothetical protein